MRMSEGLDRCGVESRWLPQGPFQHSDGMLDDRAGIDDFRVENLSPREGQELPGQVGRPLRGIHGGFQELRGLRIVTQLAAQKIDIGSDDLKDIIEIMGNPPVN